MSFIRGSEWRKWDLHVHTPASIVHEYKKGEADDVWSRYFKELEGLPPEIKVLGINDYWFLEGYKKVKDYKDSGGLNNIDLILPVVEFRLRDFVGSSQLNKINYHIIFSNELTIKELEDEFLNKLEMTEYENRSLSKENLISFGEKIKEETPLDKRVNLPSSLLQIGFNNFTVQLDVINKLLYKNCLQNKFIRVIGQTEWSDFRWEGSASDKKALINGCDFVFSASPTIEDAIKSKKSLQEQNVNDTLLHCSDAHKFHSEEYTSKILGNCYTWIKANPTFQGLQQVINEPEERIFIGDEPEVLKRVRENRTKYLKSLNINKVSGYSDTKGKWFNDINIKLNSELVAIIGNKGSGKSALSDILALLGNSHNGKHFSFLSNTKFKKKKLAENFEATIKYESDENKTLNLFDLCDNTKVERVRYLPQNYFEELCNDLEGEGFENALKRVVFSHLSDEQKLGTKDFNELIDLKINSISEDIDDVVSKIENINKDIINLENKRLDSYRKSIESSHELKYTELIEHIKNKPKKIQNPKPHEATAEQEVLSIDITKEKTILKEKEDLLENNKKTINSISIELNELNVLKNEFVRIISIFTEFKESKLEILEKYSLDFDSLIRIETNRVQIDTLIDKKLKQVNSLKKDNHDEKNKNGLIVDINILKINIDSKQKKLSEPEQEYRKYESEFQVWKLKCSQIIGSNDTINTIKYYKTILKYFKNKLEDDLKEKRNERIRLSLIIYNKKFEVIKIFKMLKITIDTVLNEYKTLLIGYNIAIDATFKFQNFTEDFFQYIQQNKMGSFYGSDEGKVKLQEIVENKCLDNQEEFKQILEFIIEHLEYDKRSDKHNESRIVFEQIKDIEKFYNYLFSLEYLSPYYELKLDNKALIELSPGEKGALLLVFYLMLDKEEIPLIIDQPEDNLDNQSVYKIVVQFIKSAKKRRQIIMVTHNPNLAVVADAEQIIYANIDKQDKNKFTIKSGSIEDLEINQCILDILEGTRPAFDTRRKKYFDK